MRVLSRLLVCLLAFFALAGCALHHEVSRDEIQAQLAARFPFEKSAGLWSVRLTDPRVRLTADNRVGVALTASAGGVGVPTVGAEVDVDGTPEYRSDQGAFYLKDVIVRRLDFTGQPPEIATPLRSVIGAVVDTVLRDRPVFVLDPKRSGTERLIKGHVRRIWVEQDKLVVEYHL